MNNINIDYMNLKNVLVYKEYNPCKSNIKTDKYSVWKIHGNQINRTE